MPDGKHLLAWTGRVLAGAAPRAEGNGTVGRAGQSVLHQTSLFVRGCPEELGIRGQMDFCEKERTLSRSAGIQYELFGVLLMGAVVLGCRPPEAASPRLASSKT